MKMKFWVEFEAEPNSAYLLGTDEIEFAFKEYVEHLTPAVSNWLKEINIKTTGRFIENKKLIKDLHKELQKVLDNEW